MVKSCQTFVVSLQVTQKFHHNEATAFLLEKKGDVRGAFAVLLEVGHRGTGGSVLLPFTDPHSVDHLLVSPCRR